MKRFLVAMLTIAMAFVFVSCEDKVEPPKEYTVNFNVQGRGEAPEAQKILEGQKANAPSNPTDEVYYIVGWYKDETCNSAWDFENDTVGGDITLYAKWVKKTFQVSFNMNGVETSLGNATVEYGEKVNKPADPVAEHNAFIGWFKDEKCLNEWDFDEETITRDTTIFAKWHVSHSFSDDVCTYCGAKKCGDNVGYTLEDGTFTLSGTGACDDYTYNSQPWSSQKSQINSVVIGDGITHVGAYSFHYATNLKGASFGRDIDSFGQYAFAYSSIEECVLPEKTVALTDYLFYHCDKLEKVVLNEGLTSIGEYSLQDTVIDRLDFPSSIETIGFWGNTPEMETITVPEDNENFIVINGLLYNKKDQTKLLYCPANNLNPVLADDTRSLERCSFAGWQGTDLVLPEMVTSIGQNAFRYSTIVNLTLPSTLNSMSYGVFVNCDNFATCTFTGNVPTYWATGQNHVFYLVSTLTAIYVPDESIDDYRTKINSSCGSKFANLVTRVSEKPVE